jgi:hypothetical protein
MGAGIDQDVELAQTMGRALRGLEPFTSRELTDPVSPAAKASTISPSAQPLWPAADCSAPAKRRLGVCRRHAVCVHGPTQRDRLPGGLGHGDPAKCHGRGREIRMQRRAIRAGDRDGERVRAKHRCASARPRHNGRRVGHAQRDHAVGCDLFGEEPQRGASVRSGPPPASPPRSRVPPPAPRAARGRRRVGRSRSTRRRGRSPASGVTRPGARVRPPDR